MNDNKKSGRIAAIFDVDGTLIANTSLERIFARWLWRRGELGWRQVPRQAVWMLGGAVQALTACRSPLAANKFYLRGQEVAHTSRLARQCFAEEIVPQLLPRALERVEWHRRAGHFVVLLSGGLDLLVAPLAERLGVHARIATRLEAAAGRLTGRIAGDHYRGAAKAKAVRTLDAHGALDLKRSFAYADHHTDQHLLALVGYPVATNADARLRRMALSHHWMSEDFTQTELICSNSIAPSVSAVPPRAVRSSLPCLPPSTRPTG